VVVKQTEESVSSTSARATAMTEQILLTVDEVAKLLKVKPSWVYAHADELGAYRLGKYLRFTWSRVKACLEQGQGQLGSQPNDQT
jgi:excisionase family DNA binding protein